MPGSSGSPVVLSPVIGRAVRNDIALGSPPALLLGIVAEGRYTDVRTPDREFTTLSDIGLAFDTTTIRETIEQFFE